MPQTINIYIGESEKSRADVDIKDTIVQEPSPSGTGLEESMSLDDSNPPEPWISTNEESDITIDDNLAPTPYSRDKMRLDEMAEDNIIPMPIDELSASACPEDIPEPEDFNETQMVKTRKKKSEVHKSK